MQRAVRAARCAVVCECAAPRTPRKKLNFYYWRGTGTYRSTATTASISAKKNWKNILFVHHVNKSGKWIRYYVWLFISLLWYFISLFSFFPKCSKSTNNKNITLHTTWLQPLRLIWISQSPIFKKKTLLIFYLNQLKIS